MQLLKGQKQLRSVMGCENRVSGPIIALVLAAYPQWLANCHGPRSLARTPSRRQHTCRRLRVVAPGGAHMARVQGQAYESGPF